MRPGILSFIITNIVLYDFNHHYNFKSEKKKVAKSIKRGPVRDLNPGPLAPKARIIPLDQQATAMKTTQLSGYKLTAGHIIKPKGPSPEEKGNFFSCSTQNITNGNVNTRVFPEPVNAMPIISRPVRL